MHPEQQFARRALKGGAAGYLTKDSVTEELKEAVKKILVGGRYVSATLAEKLAVDLRPGAETPLHELLSDREFQVLKLIASGQRLSDIAAALSLSPKTVSVYRARILEKMRFPFRAGAASAVWLDKMEIVLDRLFDRPAEGTLV